VLYAALWRALPGPKAIKALTVLVMLAVVIVICFAWLFPSVEQFLPFTNNTIAPPAPPQHPTTGH
jgi:hypothetical protein